MTRETDVKLLPKVGDEFVNRFGERIVVAEVEDDMVTVKVHRKPETAYWDVECWREESRRRANDREQPAGAGEDDSSEGKRVVDAWLMSYPRHIGSIQNREAHTLSNLIDAALRAQPQAAQAGYVLVPRDEMTDDMMNAGQQYLDGKVLALSGRFKWPGTFNWHEFWSAIIAAAPSPLAEKQHD